jgi:uncharacterized protein YxeA
MKTLLTAVLALVVTVSMSAIGADRKVTPVSEDGCSANFQDTTKKDKKKKDTTKKDTSLVAYHR